MGTLLTNCEFRTGKERLSSKYCQAHLTCRGRRTQMWEEQSRCQFQSTCTLHPVRSLGGSGTDMQPLTLPAVPLVPAQRPLPLGCKNMGSQQFCDPRVPIRPSFSPYTSSSDAVAHVDTAYTTNRSMLNLHKLLKLPTSCLPCPQYPQVLEKLKWRWSCSGFRSRGAGL